MTPEIALEWVGVGVMCAVALGIAGLIGCGIYALIKYIQDYFR